MMGINRLGCSEAEEVREQAEESVQKTKWKGQHLSLPHLFVGIYHRVTELRREVDREEGACGSLLPYCRSAPPLRRPTLLFLSS